MGADGDVRMPGGRPVVFDGGDVSDDAWGLAVDAANTAALLFVCVLISSRPVSGGGRWDACCGRGRRLLALITRWRWQMDDHNASVTASQFVAGSLFLARTRALFSSQILFSTPMERCSGNRAGQSAARCSLFPKDSGKERNDTLHQVAEAGDGSDDDDDGRGGTSDS